MTYDDAYIERWGEFFTAHPALRRLCTFEQFIAQPAAWLRRLVGGELLPAQRAVRARIDALQPRKGAGHALQQRC